jgi:hypothetical protein
MRLISKPDKYETRILVRLSLVRKPDRTKINLICKRTAAPHPHTQTHISELNNKSKTTISDFLYLCFLGVAVIKEYLPRDLTFRNFTAAKSRISN